MDDTDLDRLQLLETSNKNIDLVYDKIKREIIGAWRDEVYLEAKEFDGELRELAEKKIHALKFQEQNEIKETKNGLG